MINCNPTIKVWATKCVGTGDIKSLFLDNKG